MNPRRIVILGNAGTGKTSFSRKLARRVVAPHICLDEIWSPGLKSEDVPAFRERVVRAHAGGAWVSDGNFAAATFDLRLPKADLILWLDRPIWLSALNAFRRLAEPGQSHALKDLPDVLRFVWRFDRINRPMIMAELAAHGPNIPVRHLRNRKEEAEFLDEIGG